jgi:hypothetical protein
MRSAQEETMARKRAESISIANVSKSIDRAVALAAKRQDLRPAAGNLGFPGHLAGRILRDFGDVNAAFAFATDVSRNVKIPGATVEPAVLKIGPDILAGFIERIGTLRRF